MNKFKDIMPRIYLFIAFVGAVLLILNAFLKNDILLTLGYILLVCSIISLATIAFMEN